jgi:hypothetical protein
MVIPALGSLEEFSSTGFVGLSTVWPRAKRVDAKMMQAIFVANLIGERFIFCSVRVEFRSNASAILIACTKLKAIHNIRKGGEQNHLPILLPT